MPRAETVYTQIGRRLEDARKEAGLRRKDVADRLGMTESGYGFWETGERRIAIAELEKLGKVLGKPISYFFGENLNSDQLAMLQYMDLPSSDQQFVRELIQLLKERSRQQAFKEERVEAA